MSNMKRKCIIVDSEENEPTQRLANLLTNIADDEGKMEALIRFCEKSIETTNSSPSWAKESNSFFSSLNIKPVEWDIKYNFPKEDFQQVRNAFKMEDCEEKLNQFKNIIKSKLGIQMSTRNVYELLSAIGKIYDSSNKKDLGEIIVSSTISSLLDVLCTSPSINQNGKNMQLYEFDKTMMENFSKVMGLSFLKSVAYLFILEASFEEIQTGSKTLIVPKYSIYFKQYGVQQLSILNLWLDIAYFIKNYVPLDISEYPHQPYRPTAETPLKNLSQLDSILICAPKRMKKNKKVIREINDHDGVYVVQSASVIKTVSGQEKSIILKLLNNHQYCLYLPQILNIWEDAVEFEFLQPLTKRSYKDEFLLILACDISKALHFLHTNSIVHRDVKPSNIMIKKFRNPSELWFVLIDFGLSFEMEKDESGNCFEITEGKRIPATANYGTGIFKAPEVREKLVYDEKIDIYSLGATLLYLKNASLFSQLYMQAEENDEVVNFQKYMASIWNIEEFGQMVLRMVDLNPKNRPSAQDLEKFFTMLVDKYLEKFQL